MNRDPLLSYFILNYDKLTLQIDCEIYRVHRKTFKYLMIMLQAREMRNCGMLPEISH
jgi:hypothetical protein